MDFSDKKTRGMVLIIIGVVLLALFSYELAWGIGYEEGYQDGQSSREHVGYKGTSLGLIALLDILAILVVFLGLMLVWKAGQKGKKRGKK